MRTQPGCKSQENTGAGRRQTQAQQEREGENWAGESGRKLQREGKEAENGAGGSPRQAEPQVPLQVDLGNQRS